MKKKILSVLLAAAMTIGALAGCGGAADNSAGGTQAPSAGGEAEPDSAGMESIVVEMINYGYDDADLAMVQDEINKITEAEIGVHVNFITVPIAEMGTKLGLMVSGGEDIDIACTGLLTNPTALVTEGLLQPITDAVNSSEILSAKANGLLDACMVNGELYAYPGTLYPAEGIAWYYDADLAAEYNITIPDHIDSIDQLTTIFEQCVANGMPIYPMTMGDGVGGERSYGCPFEPLGDPNQGGYGVIIDSSKGDTIVNWYESPEYEHQVRTTQLWYEKGYTVPDSISNGYTTTDSVTQGQAFSFVAAYSVGIDDVYMSNITGKNLKTVLIGTPSLSEVGIVGTSWGVPSSSTKLDAVIKFAELMYSNKALMNLYWYGVEGTHYVVADDGAMINYPDGVDAGSVTYGAFIPMFGDNLEMYIKAPHEANYYDVVAQFGAEKSVKSKYLGYSFNPADVSTETTAVSAVITEYGPSLNCGVVDVDTVLPEFIAKLKSAGIDKIVEANQAQLDAWLAEQN